MNETTSMPFTAFWSWLETRPLAEHIGFTYWFPLLESIHVLAVGIVVGSIVMSDLRLLGFTALRYPPSRMNRELVRWTWFAFIVAVITGFGLFMTRAATYIENPAFQLKLLFLLLAGLNMAWFQYRTFPNLLIHERRETVAVRTRQAMILASGSHAGNWERADITPVPAKIAGAVSLVLWIGIVFAGRWVGHII